MDNFITREIEKDLRDGVYNRVATRFPPEPNGYLHLGHAKSIFLNFGIAEKFGGSCILRMDDTNPTTENEEYVKSIIEDVKWLGYDPDITYASDYFPFMHHVAMLLIKDGLAYVDDLSVEDIKYYRSDRSDPSKPGKNSPYRDRSVEENLKLFETMGNEPEGWRCLRAKIDMAHPNMHMRDPVLYRINKNEHHRTGTAWNIYPMYDYAHPFCDVIERITHSICTLEFENHRPLYDWVVEHVKDKLHTSPRQIEFARLNVRGITLSKRKLNELVGVVVDDWSDPRLPTISGLRARGFTPSAIRDFCEEVGVAKFNSSIDPVKLDNSIRNDLNKTADRIMAVFDPLKVTITNYTGLDKIELENNPEDLSAGNRVIPFSENIFIERDDFMEDPPKKFFRLSPGKEVRLKAACILRCNEVIKDENGKVTELLCTYDKDTSKKVKGTIHWVSANHAKEVTVNEYENLYEDEDCAEINKDSKKSFVAMVEPVELKIGKSYQFFRKGYFFAERSDMVNSTVGLRDTWSKILKKETV